MHDHLLFCNHDPSFDDFTVLAQETNSLLSEIKESLLIKRDKPVLKKHRFCSINFNGQDIL